MITSIKTLCVLFVCFTAGYTVSVLTTERDPQIKRIPQRLHVEAVMDDTDVAYDDVQPPAVQDAPQEGQEEKAYEVTLLVDFTTQTIVATTEVNGVKYTVADEWLKEYHVYSPTKSLGVVMDKVHKLQEEHDALIPVKQTRVLVKLDKPLPDADAWYFAHLVSDLYQKGYRLTVESADGFKVSY